MAYFRVPGMKSQALLLCHEEESLKEFDFHDKLEIPPSPFYLKTRIGITGIIYLPSFFPTHKGYRPRTQVFCGYYVNI